MGRPSKLNSQVCGAKLGNGKICRRPAGWGVAGMDRGPCKMHGGNFPDVQAHAARKEAWEGYGAWADIDAAEAILLCIRIAAGEVFFFDNMVKQLEEEDIVETEVTRTRGFNSLGDIDETRTSNKASLHVYIRARQDAMDRLMRYSKTAIELQLDERRVRAAEQWGLLLGQLIKAVLGDLQLTAAQQEAAPHIVRKRLLELEAGS